MPSPQLIVLLSGAVSSGKTTLGTKLVQRFQFELIKTKAVLQSFFPDSANERGALQDHGTYLDQKTHGTWVRDEIVARVNKTSPKYVLVDAVRIEKQVDAIRKAYGPRVFHIHLDAPTDVLTTRYRRRKIEGFKEFPAYKEVGRNKTENRISRMAEIADVVIKTDRCTEEDVFVRAASHLGLYGAEHEPLVDVVIGGEFGSEGKGHIVSFLAREYDLLIRVGGPNAGHKVFRVPEPYTHHQLPSGTLFSEAKLLIGPGAILNVPALLREIADCGVSRERLTIDPQAMIIEVEDIKAEKKLVQGIGSTGQGVGSATARRIWGRAGKKIRLAKDVPELKPYTASSAAEQLEQAYATRRKILLEGTQGTGLSLFHGPYPYVTSRDTTVAGLLSETGIAPRRVRKIVMVCRSYPIRVQNPSRGTSGPLSQEISWKVIAERSGIPLEELRSLEKTSTTNRKRRVGEFEWDLLRKAASLNGPTDIALTFADYLGSINTQARRFEQLTSETIRFTEEVERVSGAPVSLISTRFHWRSIIDRRSW
ncbi:MAG TPA: adenylosuccinate synthetase [Candidatus Sulfotelmatobacter sp.]|jgi:adenylosuccinate synthase|nr:adenylosuccinate synthetase [Candidatus Sulfotelmatobacter sp.]